MKKSFYLKTAVAVGLMTAGVAFRSPTWFDAHPFLDKLAETLGLWQEKTSPEKLYIHTDKTFLKPNEDLWFKVYVRDAASLKASPKSEIVYVQVLDPRGSVLKDYKLLAIDGVASGDFNFPSSSAGGIYKIKAYTQWMQNTQEFFEKEITVQKAVLPRLRMKLDFVRKAYSKGDKVAAELDLASLENKPLSNYAFNYVVNIDGKGIVQQSGVTDANGHAVVQFTLPQDLKSSDGLLNIMLAYNGQTESISRSVPIVMNNIDLQFFPEGGDMVQGIETELGFKALNEFGKPADLTGEIVETATNRVITRFKSFHDGMGAVRFKPEAGKKYQARILQPADISKTYELPTVLERGYVLNIKEQNKENIDVLVKTTENETLFLVAQVGGKIYHKMAINAQSGNTPVNIPTAEMPIGICQLSLFDSREVARAERLVFVNKHKQLKVDIKTDKEKYLPREKVKMNISVKDERGMPMPAHLSLSVVDDKLLSFADDKQSNILSSVLLDSDIKGKVEEPNFYFDEKEKDADKALSYLLMTQGWRRFQWEKVLDKKMPNYALVGEMAQLSGRVTDKADKPMINVPVRVVGKNIQTKTDAEGRFTLKGVELLETVFVEAAILNETPIKIPVEHYDNDIHFKQGMLWGIGILKGTIKDGGSGEPLMGATVQITQNGAFINGVVTDIDGRYELKAPAGKYDVLISYVGYSTTQANALSLGGYRTTIFDKNLEENQVLLESVVTAVAKDVKRGHADKKTHTRAVAPPTMVAPQAIVRDIVPADNAKMDFDDVELEKTEENMTVAGMVVADEPRKMAEIAVVEEREMRRADENVFVDGVRVRGQVALKIPNGDDFGGLDGIPAEVENDRAFGEAKLKQEVANKDKAKNLMGKKQNNIVAKPAAPPVQPDYKVKKTDYYQARQFYVPQYANTNTESRSDFRSTIYWNPNLVVGRNGTAEVEFYMSDDVTQFCATVEGFGTLGSLAHSEYTFFSQLPFAMYTKVPAQVLSGDRLNIPLTLVNNTSNLLNGVLDIKTPANLRFTGNLSKNYVLQANEKRTVYLEYLVLDSLMTDNFDIAFKAGAFGDQFTQEVVTKPRGFPVVENFTDTKLNNVFDINIQEPVAGSVKIKFSAQPNMLNDVLSSLDKMLRQPGGCFEQTSSSNYPNILALQYMKETNTVNPTIEKQANAYLADGYKKLLAYEIKGTNGFDIWGTGPAHEGLTAYGLLQFTDMKSVYPVEADLLERTAKFLLTRRMGDGSWNKDNKAGHGFIDEPEIADGYVTYAMAVTGFGKEIKKEIEKTYKDATATKDPYVMGLCANVLLAVGDSRANAMLDDLMKTQLKDGSFPNGFVGKKYSITHSTDKYLAIETTSLAIMAMIKAKKFGKPLQEAVSFLMKSRDAYGFGSTQSTVMALKALVENAKNAKRIAESGEIAIFVDGRQVATRSFQKDEDASIEIKGLERYLKEGKHKVEVRFVGMKEPLPFDLEVNYTTRLPKDIANAKLKLDVNMNATTAKMGETVRLTAKFQNISEKPLASPMLKIGIPAGLSLQPWQLKELKDKGVFNFYEIHDGYLALHYIKINPNDTREVNLDLKADVTGIYESPASSAFLYYTPNHIVWDMPEKLTIKE